MSTTGVDRGRKEASVLVLHDLLKQAVGKSHRALEEAVEREGLYLDELVTAEEAVFKFHMSIHVEETLHLLEFYKWLRKHGRIRGLLYWWLRHSRIRSALRAILASLPAVALGLASGTGLVTVLLLTAALLALVVYWLLE